ncbi:MAG: sulfite reductase [Desulforegulaceae bacterium]|nr:sulfite reductase [Desulforegulaceae bacterium]
MQWSAESKKELLKVPFFVRKKVKNKVEDYVKKLNLKLVEPIHLEEAKNSFLENMEKEIKGYSLEACFGEKNCKNAIKGSPDFLNKIESLLVKKDILSFLKKNSKGQIKFHQEFKISVSFCPNSCSRPQIAGIGLIAASKPVITKEPCIQCMECVKVCRERAVFFKQGSLIIDYGKCLYCSDCIKKCPTSTIAETKKGFRVLVGGKLGRHPRLGRDLGEIYSENQVLKIINSAADFMVSQKKGAKRFSDIFNEEIYDSLKQGAEK